MVRHSATAIAALVFTFAGSSMVAAQAPAQDSPAVRVGGPIKAPLKTKNVAPVYPALARSAGTEGVVILELLIAPAGTVQETRVLKSVPLLDQAAVDAVRQWEYEPTLVGGVAVPVRYNITVAFSLRATDPNAVPDAAADPAAAPAPNADPAGRQQQADGPAQPADGLAQAPVRVGGIIKAPTKVVDVPPVYPDAIASRPQGVVILELLVAPQGYVQDARVLKSVPELDQAAIDAVMQWVYTPTLLNGVAVPVIYNVTVAFTPR